MEVHSRIALVIASWKWLFIVSDSLTISAIAHRLQLSTRFQTNWPTPFPFYPSYRLFFCNDILSPLVELDDGVWRSASSRAIKLGRESDTGNAIFVSLYRAYLIDVPS